MFLPRVLKQTWVLVLPADCFPMRPLEGLGPCYMTGGTCMLWERFLPSSGVGLLVGATAGRVGLSTDGLQVSWPQLSQGPRGLTLSFSTSVLFFFLSALPRFCPSTLGAPSPLGFLSRLLRFPADAAPVSSVSRPSSHDFSFCLSDSFKQKHTSKAPQRGSSLNFSDLWFSCPFFPLPLFLLPFSFPGMLALKSLEWHGGRSSGTSAVLYSSKSWRLPLPLLVSHKPTSRAAQPGAWGGFRSIIRSPLQSDPSAPFPDQAPGGQLMFPTAPLPPAILSPHSFPAGPLALLGITCQYDKMLRGDLLSLLIGRPGQGNYVGVCLNFSGDNCPAGFIDRISPRNPPLLVSPHSEEMAPWSVWGGMSLPHLLRGKNVWSFIRFSPFLPHQRLIGISFPFLTWSVPDCYYIPEQLTGDGPRAKPPEVNMEEQWWPWGWSLGGKSVPEAREPQGLMLVAEGKGPSLKACPRVELLGEGMVALCLRWRPHGLQGWGHGTLVS